MSFMGFAENRVRVRITFAVIMASNTTKEQHIQWHYIKLLFKTHIYIPAAFFNCAIISSTSCSVFLVKDPSEKKGPEMCLA